jgi:hypothetical protein
LTFRGTERPKIEANDIKSAIRAGLRKAWTNHFARTGERDEDIVPEYLTTAAVCDALADYVNDHKLHGRITVRAEEQTRSLWAKIQMLAFLRGTKRSELQRESDRRPGNVDISIATKGNGFERTFAVAEIKGFLTFDNNGDLYQQSRDEVQKDLLRNAEFVVGRMSAGGVEYSAFTFYLRDKASVLKSDGRKYCQDKKAFFEAEARRIVGAWPALLLDVEVETLEENLFDSAATAQAVDEEGGPPTYMAEGHWHILYGIISIYRAPVTLRTSKD